MSNVPANHKGEVPRKLLTKNHKRQRAVAQEKTHCKGRPRASGLTRQRAPWREKQAGAGGPPIGACQVPNGKQALSPRLPGLTSGPLAANERPWEGLLKCAPVTSQWPT